jgi:sugar phosphate isomerase/epimerase
VSNISVQLWSVRDDCKKDFAKTLKAIAKMGYDAVEFAGLHDHKPAELKKILDDAGLKCSGAHVGIDQFDEANFNNTVETYKALGCDYPIIPGLPPALRDSPDACKRTAKRFMAIAGRLAPLGMKTGFHLHDADVQQLFDPATGRRGKSAWELFCELTPNNFLMQHDTGNAMQGGADALWTLQHYPSRCVSVHCKEFPLDGCAIGEGKVPWKDVLALCTKAKTKWLVVEHEIYTKYEPMKAIEQAIKGLKSFIA